MSTRTPENEKSGYFQHGKCQCGKDNVVFWMDEPSKFYCLKCCQELVICLLQDCLVVQISNNRNKKVHNVVSEAMTELRADLFERLFGRVTREGIHD